MSSCQNARGPSVLFRQNFGWSDFTRAAGRAQLRDVSQQSWRTAAESRLRKRPPFQGASQTYHLSVLLRIEGRLLVSAGLVYYKRLLVMHLSRQRESG